MLSSTGKNTTGPSKYTCTFLAIDTLDCLEGVTTGFVNVAGEIGTANDS